jgi:plastocyanin
VNRYIASWFRGFALVTALAFASGVATAGATPAPIILINQFKFDNADLTVDVGTTVQFINRDQTVHNVVSRDGKFASTGLDTGDAWSFTFTAPGDYAYFCALHPHMTGVVHVKAKA